jgi:hypothetical protein
VTLNYKVADLVQLEGKCKLFLVETLQTDRARARLLALYTWLQRLVQGQAKVANYMLNQVNRLRAQVVASVCPQEQRLLAPVVRSPWLSVQVVVGLAGRCA